MASTMRYGFVNAGACVLLVHSADAPSLQEWQAYLKALGENAAAVRRIFVYTLSGGPSASQRSDFNDLMQRLRLSPTIAIVGGSALVRGIVTAFNWIQKNSMKLFPPEKIGEAYTYLGLTKLDQAALFTMLKQFCTELGLPQPMPPK